MWRRRRNWIRACDHLVPRVVHQWSMLDDAERERLLELTRWMVRSKRWEAAREFVLSDEVVVAIAANASLLLLGLDRSVYRHVRAVVIHRSTITQRGPRSTTMRGVVSDGPLRVLGHALDRRGPVVLSWAAVQRDLRDPGRGESVVLHEFAHKLDATDGLFDGTPEMPGRSDRAEWVRVCTAEYRRLRRRQEPDPVLRRYATTNPSEFFAVATEAFLGRPVDLAAHHPALYRVLGDYYGQDPAARLLPPEEEVSVGGDG